MTVPESDVARVQRWCAARVPENTRDQLRIECDLAQRHLTIVERRPPWHENLGPDWTHSTIARLRYNATDKSRPLYWSDQHQRFHLYDQLAPSRSIDDLLAEIGLDLECTFWG